MEQKINLPDVTGYERRINRDPLFKAIDRRRFSDMRGQSHAIIKIIEEIINTYPDRLGDGCELYDFAILLQKTERCVYRILKPDLFNTDKEYVLSKPDSLAATIKDVCTLKDRAAKHPNLDSLLRRDGLFQAGMSRKWDFDIIPTMELLFDKITVPDKPERSSISSLLTFIFCGCELVAIDGIPLLEQRGLKENPVGGLLRNQDCLIVQYEQKEILPDIGACFESEEFMLRWKPIREARLKGELAYPFNPGTLQEWNTNREINISVLSGFLREFGTKYSEDAAVLYVEKHYPYLATKKRGDFFGLTGDKSWFSRIKRAQESRDKLLDKWPYLSI